MKRALVLALLAALPGALVAQTTYRWVDEQGKVHYSDQPPPPAVKQLEEKRYSTARPDPTLAYTVRKAAADYPVTLYTADNCGDPCAKARDLLGKRGIPFSEKSVQSKEDVDAFKQLFKGKDEVPAATVGSQQLLGFQEPAWHKLLDDAGYPRTPLPAR